MNVYIKNPQFVEAIQLKLSTYEQIDEWVNREKQKKVILEKIRDDIGTLTEVTYTIFGRKGADTARLYDYIVKDKMGVFSVQRREKFEDNYTSKSW